MFKALKEVILALRKLEKRLGKNNAALAHEAATIRAAFEGRYTALKAICKQGLLQRVVRGRQSRPAPMWIDVFYPSVGESVPAFVERYDLNSPRDMMQMETLRRAYNGDL